MMMMMMVLLTSVHVVGELSQRMQIPGNVWVDVWQSARPVPARRQRRLFDDTKEAEKVCTRLAVYSYEYKINVCRDWKLVRLSLT